MLGDEDHSLDRNQRLLGRGGQTMPVVRGGYYGEVGAWAFEEPAGEFRVDLLAYWRLLMKHRVMIAGIFFVAVVVGVAATLLMTPVYTASTTLQIDRESARVMNTTDVAPNETMAQGEEFFQTQYGLLKARSLAERVIQNLGLASSDAFLKSMGVKVPQLNPKSRKSLSVLRQEAVLEAVQKNLAVTPTRGSRLVSVKFSSPDPVMAARVANAFAEGFIQSNLDRRFESSSYARTFLEQRIAQTKAKLEEAERQLVAYATEQQIITVKDGQGGPGQSLMATDLSSTNSSLATVKATRVAAEAKWRQANSGQLMALTEVLQNPTIQKLTEQRAEALSEYQQKLKLFKPDFPEMLQIKAQIDELDRQISTVANNIRTSIEGQYREALGQEQALQRQVNGLKGDVLDLSERSIRYNILQRELDTSRTLYDGLLQRYKEIGVTGGITANNISIVDRADPPNLPSKPNLLVNLALAAMLGAGLGILSAFVVEGLDESITTPEEVEAKLGLAVLGAIPMLEKGVQPLDAMSDIRSSFAEAYYSLRTALQFSTADGVPRVLLITSSRPSEGKSTTALAIAKNLARVGHRVLLIDADLRKPSLHRLLGLSADVGLSSVLAGAALLSDAAVPTSDRNLLAIPAGPLPPNPAELLSGPRMRDFLAEAQAHFDHVVIDGPPVLGLADAPMLSSVVTGTVMVVESRGTRRGQARGALRRLSMARGKVLGVILTKFRARGASYGGYDYAYDYAYGGNGGAGYGRRKSER
jgi:succinoglycan biosynthesis transport protein ExoP